MSSEGDERSVRRGRRRGGGRRRPFMSGQDIKGTGQKNFASHIFIVYILPGSGTSRT